MRRNTGTILECSIARYPEGESRRSMGVLDRSGSIHYNAIAKDFEHKGKATFLENEVIDVRELERCILNH